MWPIALASFAFAGTLRIHAQAPVSYRVDGVWVGRMVTDATVDPISVGHHVVEVCDAHGNVIGSLGVTVGSDPVYLEYNDRRIEVVTSTQIGGFAYDPTVHPPVMTLQEWTLLEHDMARGRDKKRMKVLVKAIESHWFEMRHVDSLLTAFDGLDPRIEAAVLLAYKTVDPQRFGAIEDQFPPGASRERVRRAFDEQASH